MRAIAGKYKGSNYEFRLPSKNPQRVIRMKNGLAIKKLTDQEWAQAQQGITINLFKN